MSTRAAKKTKTRSSSSAARDKSGSGARGRARTGASRGAESVGEIERTFPETFGLFGGSMFGSGPAASGLKPLSSVEVTHDSVKVTFDIPGVSREGISVTCTDDFISIEAETRKEFSKGTGRNTTISGAEFTRYSERIRLPVLVDPDKGTARFNNGMLVVKLPRVHQGKAVRVTSDNDEIM